MDNAKEFEDKVRKIRNDIVDQSYKSKTGHIGSAMSCTDIITYLYYEYLTSNDYFILSKGHACMALYSVLYDKNIISKKDFDNIGIDNGTLLKHPNKNIKLGIKVSTGSLGHGLSLGAGIAYGLRQTHKRSKVVVLLGDGECQEGSVWEAAMFIAHHNLNVLPIIDCNTLQAMGRVKDIINLYPIVDKLKSFGFDVYLIDGHRPSHLDRFFTVTTKEYRERPIALLLHTVKGKGMADFEGKLESHYHILDENTYKRCKECINKVEQ